jgi:hypothetical protein
MKPTMKTVLTAILLLVLSCTKENTVSHSSTVTQSTNKALTFTIGQHYGGGIIFYIDSTRQHGLIADTVDLPNQSVWWNGTYTTTGAVGTIIGKGKANTKKIMLAQGDSGIHYAARRCWHYKGSGYKDWFLPSKDELNELYKLKNVVGGFANDYYWSSSEWHPSHAWRQHFLTGSQGYADSKQQSFYVRAIRAF